MQALAAVHDTPASAGAEDPFGPATRWSDHDEPFHCSGSPIVPDPPTAVHALAEVHATALSVLSVKLCGFGVG